MIQQHSFVRRLQLGLAVLVGVGLLSLGMGVTAEQRLRQAMARSSDALWRLQHFEQVQIRLGTARAAEREFLLEDLRAPTFFQTGTSPALVSQAGALDDLKSLLDALEARTASRDAALAEIRVAVSSYEQHFQELVSRYRERGSAYTGLLGEMRRASYELQEALAKIREPERTELRAELLELVRDQSDYLRDLDNRPRFLVSERIQVLREELSSLPGEGPPEIRTPLQDYQRAWSRLIEIDEQIGRSSGSGVRGSLRDAEETVVPLTVAAVEAAARTFDQAARSVQRTAALARGVSTAAALSAALVALFLALSLSHHLRRSMSALLRAVDAYARGDRGARVGALPRQDEFAVLGTSFDHLAETLAEATEELEEINASLELAVKGDTDGLLDRIRALVSQRKPPGPPASGVA